MITTLGGNNDLIFVPHLLPVARGILATITVPLREWIDNPLELWNEEYAGEPFVEVTNEQPALRDVGRGPRRALLRAVTPLDNGHAAAELARRRRRAGRRSR